MSHVPRVCAFGRGKIRSISPLMILFLVNLGPVIGERDNLSEFLRFLKGLCNFDGQNHRRNTCLAALNFCSKQQTKPFVCVDGLLHQAKVQEN